MLSVELCTKVHFSSDRRLLHHKSRTIGTPGVNLSIKMCGRYEGKMS